MAHLCSTSNSYGHNGAANFGGFGSGADPISNDGNAMGHRGIQRLPSRLAGAGAYFHGIRMKEVRPLILEIGLLTSLVAAAYVLFTRNEDHTQRVETQLRDEIRQQRAEIKEDIRHELGVVCRGGCRE
jgi:hypothetical protein